MLLITIVVIIPLMHAWHAYNISSIYEIREGCDSYENATRLMSIEEFNQMKLWPGLMKPFDLAHGETMYGFTAGMREIWKNQFPQDCSNAKFLISGGWPYGFGSRIHVEGWGLALAMHLGRIYLPHPDGDNIFWETSIPFCREKWDSTLTCFYEAWSNCTMKDALAGLQGDVNSLRVVNPPDVGASFDSVEERNRVIHLLENDKSINIVFTTGHGTFNAHAAIPHSVQHIIDCSPMRADVSRLF